MFLDETADDLVPIARARFEAETLEAMRRAGTPPEIAYAFRKTGLLLLKSHYAAYPPEIIREWEAAIAEYFEQEKRAKDRGKL